MSRMVRPQPGTFGARIWECLEDEENPMTQAAIAARLGVSGPTARDYLYAGSLPRMKKLREIAGKLRVDSGWLFDGSGLKRPQVTTRIATIASVLEPWLAAKDWELSVQERAGLYEYLLAELDGQELAAPLITRRLDALARLSLTQMRPKNPRN